MRKEMNPLGTAIYPQLMNLVSNKIHYIFYIHFHNTFVYEVNSRLKMEARTTLILNAATKIDS
jgi:hypothetical protein